MKKNDAKKVRTPTMKDIKADKRYEFMFVAPALPIPGAVGSPINPLAIK